MGEGTRERISYKSVSGPCISIKNPKIYLPVEVTGDPAYNTNMQFLDLPDISKFERIHGTRAELNSLRFLGASHRLMESNWGEPQCSAFTHYMYMIGTNSAGEQFHYEGNAVLEENVYCRQLVFTC